MTGGGGNDRVEEKERGKKSERRSVVMFQEVNHRLGLV